MSGWEPCLSTDSVRIFALSRAPESIFPPQRLRIADLPILHPILSYPILHYISILGVSVCRLSVTLENALGDPALGNALAWPGPARWGKNRCHGSKNCLFTWHPRTNIRPRSGQSGVQTVPNGGFERPEAARQPRPAGPSLPGPRTAASGRSRRLQKA